MKIDTIIFDWAGTTVDYGSNAPVSAFISAFESFGINISEKKVRAYMGLPKKKHVEKLLEDIGEEFTQNDVNEIYARFEPALFKVLANHADPLPGVVETVAEMRKLGIKMGSTTGYTKAMMDVIVPLAKEKGYSPDCIVCPDDTGGIGRPEPYMLWKNLEKLGVKSIHSVLKVGDTEADMQEAKNAGCLCAGVLEGSSMLAMNGDKEIAKQKYIEAGADYVIESIEDLPNLIEKLNIGN